MKKARILITLDAELLTILQYKRATTGKGVATQIQLMIENDLAREFGCMPWGVYKQAYQPKYADYLAKVRRQLDGE